MNELHEIAVLEIDMAMLRDTLSAVNTYLQAVDLATAQMALTNLKYSPLNQDVQRSLNKVDGYLRDFAYNTMYGVEETEEEVVEEEENVVS